MGVFMREPLLDWQQEARVVNAKRSAPASAKDPISAAETADPADMHVNLMVHQLTDVPCLFTKLCPLCDCSFYHISPHCLQLCKASSCFRPFCWVEDSSRHTQPLIRQWCSVNETMVCRWTMHVASLQANIQLTSRCKSWRPSMATQLIGRHCKPLSREMPITTTEPQSCLVRSSVWMSKCGVYWIKQLIQTFLAGPGKAGSHGCDCLYSAIYQEKFMLCGNHNRSLLRQQLIAHAIYKYGD